MSFYKYLENIEKNKELNFLIELAAVLSVKLGYKINSNLIFEDATYGFAEPLPPAAPTVTKTPKQVKPVKTAPKKLYATGIQFQQRSKGSVNNLPPELINNVEVDNALSDINGLLRTYAYDPNVKSQIVHELIEKMLKSHGSLAFGGDGTKRYRIVPKKMTETTEFTLPIWLEITSILLKDSTVLNEGLGNWISRQFQPDPSRPTMDQMRQMTYDRVAAAETAKKEAATKRRTELRNKNRAIIEPPVPDAPAVQDTDASANKEAMMKKVDNIASILGTEVHKYKNQHPEANEVMMLKSLIKHIMSGNLEHEEGGNRMVPNFKF